MLENFQFELFLGVNQDFVQTLLCKLAEAK